MNNVSWRKFPSFRWKKSADGETYSCAFDGRLISLRQDPTHLHYRVIKPRRGRRGFSKSPQSNDGTENQARGEREECDLTETFLQHYLNLQPNLATLYQQWSKADKNFEKKAPRFTGVRILKQDAWEALVGFICSSNNNIARISQMMDKLCMHYGSLIGHVDDTPFYDMPAPSALTGPKVEMHLRELGFGYRAKYLYQTAIKVSNEPEDWLNSLRNPESPMIGQLFASAGEMLPAGRWGYRHAHQQLLELQGVGPKVADCVCLMGLGWGEAVPVDTHVWQIAQRDYKFGKGKYSSLTKATYDAVADHFRKIWGKEAGWAHSVLFTADLRAFSERLTAKLELNGSIKAEDKVAPDTTIRQATVRLEVAPALPAQEGEEEHALIELKEQVSLGDTREGDIVVGSERGISQSLENPQSLSRRSRIKLEDKEISEMVERMGEESDIADGKITVMKDEEGSLVPITKHAHNKIRKTVKNMIEGEVTTVLRRKRGAGEAEGEIQQKSSIQSPRRVSKRKRT